MAYKIMATAVASRFAVLSMDDDEDSPKRNQKKKVENKKAGTGIPTQKTDSSQKKKNKKSDSGKPPQPNSNTKSKGKIGKGEGSKDGQQKKKSPSQEQWDQWKKKDSEFVDGNYEQDLHQAILLSKLDYEEKKDFYELLKKDADEEKKSAGKKNKRSNKAQPMSLEQFNNLHSEVTGESCISESVVNSKVNEHDEEFFERIDNDTRKALDREQILGLRKAREPFIQETITIAQFEDTLEERNKEIKSLKEEVVKLKEELHNVKTRNKKLCNILALGEMKDKAEALFEVDKLRRVKDELSTEVSSLHAQLEQERSKVRALTSDCKSKAQHKKRVASETTQ
ncbi:G kinase-anchoring protein 1-like isoform X2 [Zootermopsis nevadensis]|uniref:G kinase-anchoring protein 1-like isoform X2 n=1 Tax=Zootermopsis nevadensis TaxID=136037 RepID=UPI000B8E4D0C|nr:G kinase-anchoring protein 1-like isoform X2 [Zootermopsis nevadensis]